MPTYPSAALASGAVTILIAEDEESVRSLMTRALAGHGFRVVEAASAEEALTLHALNPAIDLVVANLALPGISGPNLAALLADQGLQAPVLFISGCDDDIETVDGPAYSNLPLLRRPFTPQSILQAVRQLLPGS